MVGWMPQPVILVSCTVAFLSWAACGSGGAERREKEENIRVCR